MDILDTAGQEEYSSLREMYCITGQGFLIVYDITDRQSFLEAKAMYSWACRVKNEDKIPAVSPLYFHLLCVHIHVNVCKKNRRITITFCLFI